MITFSRKSFPQSVEAFQGLDGIIIDSFDTGQLSKEQKRALRKWVKKSGGKLLLTGGSQQEGSKDSLEGIGKNFGIVQEGVEVSTLPDLEGEESGTGAFDSYEYVGVFKKYTWNS